MVARNRAMPQVTAVLRRAGAKEDV